MKRKKIRKASEENSLNRSWDNNRTPTGKWRPVSLSGLLSLLLLAVIVGLVIFRFEIPPLAPGNFSEEKSQVAPAVRPLEPTVEAIPPTERAMKEKNVGWPFKPGDVLLFKFSVERSLEVTHEVEGSQVPEDGGADISTSLKGLLFFRVYEESESHFTVGFEVAEIEGSMGSSKLGEIVKDDEIVAGMYGEVIAKMHRLGKIDSLSFPESTTIDGRNCWRDLLSLWQVVLPDDDSVSQWQVIEENTTGRYVASYERNQDEKRSEIIKEKRAYLEVRSKEQGQVDWAGSMSVSGRATIVADPLPLKIEGEEEHQLRAEILPQTIVGELVYSFQRQQKEYQADLIGEADRQEVRYLQPTALGATEFKNVATGYEKLDEAAVPKYLMEFQPMLSNFGLQSSEAAAYMARLVEHMKNDPRVVEAAMERLREDLVSDALAALFIGSLGAAGTPPAQAGLQEMFLGESWSAERRVSAMLAFAQVEAPQVDVDDRLIDLHEEKGEFASNALLLVTAVGRRIKDSDSERFARIDSYVRDSLLRGDLTRAEQITALEALGNLAPRETPPQVEEAFEAGDEEVRSSAVRSLRETFDDRADGLLVKALRDDPSEVVRTAAAEVLAENERASAEGLLEEALKDDESEEVRKKILLKTQKVSDPAMREAIAGAAENDSSKEIRDLATWLLERTDGS